MMNFGCLKNRAFWFALPLSAAFLLGILSTQHYLPSSSDQLIDIQAASLFAVAAVAGLLAKRCAVVNGSTVCWLAFLVLVAAQPVLHCLPYPDALIFPFGSLLSAGLLAYAVGNFSATEKETVMRVLSAALLIGGLATVGTQWVQLMLWQWEPWVYFGGNTRLTGNMAQPNQAAYVEVLAMAAALYWTQTGKTPLRVYGLAALLLFFLSIGIGFSASRGGFLMALIVVPVAVKPFSPNLRSVMVRSVVLWLVFAVGYLAGTWLMQHFSTQEISSVSRLAAGSDHQRLWIYERAFMAFREHPWLGIGWGQFNSFGLTHAQNLKLFISVENAHMLPFQIAAELGVVGLLVLLGFAVVLYKAFRQPEHSNGQKLAALVVLVTLMYSCTEFPLWFARYLLPFAVCMAVLDPFRFSAKTNLSSLGVLLGALVCAVSLYLADSYMQYARAIYQSRSSQEFLQKLSHVSTVFGYSQYNEFLYFLYAPVDGSRIREQTALGVRVVNVSPNIQSLLKLGDLWVMQNDFSQAQYYFQAACLLDYAHNCDRQVLSHLLRDLSPEQRQKIWPEFAAWYQSRFQKLPAGLPSEPFKTTPSLPTSTTSMEKKQ